VALEAIFKDPNDSYEKISVGTCKICLSYLACVNLDQIFAIFLLYSSKLLVQDQTLACLALLTWY
jgi:hypothetical protein